MTKRSDERPGPEVRGPMVVMYQVGGGDDMRIGLITKKITGIETSINESMTIVYYSRPSSRSVNVAHTFDEVLEALWPADSEES